jgi:type IV pilus assembly protein PilW
MRKPKLYFHVSDKGFTLIELMITLVISLMVSTAIYGTFESQNKSYIVLERDVEMQQSLRSAIITMEQDIQMACFDPKQTGSFTITNAAADRFEFQYDRNSNEVLDSNEDFAYELYPTSDSDPTKLHKRSGGSAIAYNIDELRFAYAYDADGNGSIDTAGGEIIWAVPNSGTWFNLDTNNDGKIDTNDTAGGSDTGTSFDQSDIRAVKVWVLVRSSRTDSTYTNPNTYVVGDLHLTPGDHYRRRLGRTTIQLRNKPL